jgi:hypothetical protein
LIQGKQTYDSPREGVVAGMKLAVGTCRDLFAELLVHRQ